MFSLDAVNFLLAKSNVYVPSTSVLPLCALVIETFTTLLPLPLTFTLTEALVRLSATNWREAMTPSSSVVKIKVYMPLMLETGRFSRP